MKPKKPVTKCLCPGEKGMQCNVKDCSCPLHFATWREYQQARKSKGVREMSNASVQGPDATEGDEASRVPEVSGHLEETKC